MINSYLEKHYKEILGKVKGVTKNHELTEDLLQDCILAFLEKGPDYTTKVLNDNKVQHYIVRMAHIQFNSKTSPFYTKYKKLQRENVNYSGTAGSKIDFYELDYEEGVVIRAKGKESYDVIEEKELYEDKDTLTDDIKIYIGKLPFNDRHYAQRHLIDGVSQREISKFYNINRTHISTSIDLTKKNIRMNFNRDDYKTE